MGLGLSDFFCPSIGCESAINANEIKIVFNKELDKESAETISNYSIDTIPLQGNDSVKLQADKKSVVITLATDTTGVEFDGLLDNNTAYEVAVSKELVLADGSKLGTNQSKTLLFIDKDAPELVSVKTEEDGDIVILFNERLDESVSPNIVINEVAVDSANIIVNSDGTVTVVSTDSAVTALTDGKSYTLVVEGAKDLIGNAMGLTTTTFVYNVLYDVPTLLSSKASGETSIELGFNEALVGLTTAEVEVYKNGIPVALSAAPTTTDTGKTWKLDFNYGDVYTSSETSVNLTVVIEGYKDLENNVGEKVTRTVTLSKDTVKPTVTKTSYDADTDTVTLTFSEELSDTFRADYVGKLFVTDKNGVKYNVVETPDAGDSVTELIALDDVVAGTKTISFDASEFANGTYFLTIQDGAFKDTANTPNKIASTTVSFSKGNVSDSDSPTVDAVGEITKGQFTVTFSESVKGGAVEGSATALGNYKINGSALPAGTTIYLNETQDVATITLPEGAIATSGFKLLTVSGVQDLGGNAMEETTKLIELTENTPPVLQSAKVVGNELVLTFSENVDNAINLDFADFVVKVNGVDVTEAAGTVSVAKNQFAISVSDANLATGVVTVAVDDAANATDSEGNALVVGTSVTATR